MDRPGPRSFSVAEKIGCTTETLRRWVRQAERDAGKARRIDHRRTGAPERARKGESGAQEGERDPPSCVGFFRTGGTRPPEMMVAFIDRHREAVGVESICRTLQFAPSAYYERRKQAQDAGTTLSTARRPTTRCGQPYAACGKTISGSTAPARSGANSGGKATTSPAALSSA